MLDYKRQWAYSFDQDRCWETYDTKEEAIAAGIEDAKERKYSKVYVGECGFYYPEIDEDHILETMREDAYESIFGEYSEDWLDSVSVQDVRKLGKMLNDALHEWLRQTGNVPTFYICDASEEIAVDTGEGC